MDSINEISSDFNVDILFSQLWHDPSLSFAHLPSCKKFVYDYYYYYLFINELSSETLLWSQSIYMKYGGQIYAWSIRRTLKYTNHLEKMCMFIFFLSLFSINLETATIV